MPRLLHHRLCQRFLNSRLDASSPSPSALSKIFTLQIFEFALGCLVSFTIGFVKDFHTADFASLIHVCSNIEAAFEKVAKEVDFAWALVVKFQRFFLALVRQRYFFGI